MTVAPVAVIGGTGLYALMDEFDTHRHELFATPWGEPSSPLVCGEVSGTPAVFMARHGFTHRLPPHKINYRANLWMLKEAGVKQVVAVNAVGSLHPDCPPASLALPDQIVDYSYGREQSYFSDDPEQVVHIDFTEPYSRDLRELLLQKADESNISLYPQGVYGCTQGPRLETAAEIKRLRQDGCDFVGMTGMPEAALARELELDYVSLCVVANWAAGLGDEKLTMDIISAYLQQGMQQARLLLKQLLKNV